ncbi:phage major capsid protein, P2 family [Novosphingopyxis sp. YJ-S2-01]|uniref:phage major capsid protein, P2 family n=1 Tax=Novosphingopyxis sp. YJ-S2-01 TaxID=2794021 RepID=UPI0018DCCC82|nr:phage major capsid protein, P2 family [Novosphingopyxis sp. YJ-S2-01]MBH9537883.1 phage major capsid protein, P2 family [Novosphingopyxis sp. YJ-S2-01]
MNIRPETEDRFSRYVEAVLEANGRDPGADPLTVAARSFAVDPTVQQQLLDRIQQSDLGLFAKFNNILVNEIKGEKIFMGTSGKVVASTTDTDVNERKPVSPIELADDQYECTVTDWDTIIKFAFLDSWAKFPDFEARIGRWLVRAQVEDRLKIAFNGTHRAATSNRDANPLGQDVNKGWLQHIREQAPAQNITEIQGGSGKVTYGAGGDYRSIDQLVLEAYHDVISQPYRASGNIVCFISEGLLSDRHFKLVDQDKPSEEIAADQIIQTARVGTRPVEIVPWFPEGTILLTSHENLSRYEQEGSRRRKIEQAPQRRGFVNWESFNEAFVVEEYGKAALIENIAPFEAPEA